MKRLLFFFILSAASAVHAQVYEPGQNAPDQTAGQASCPTCDEKFQRGINALESIDLLIKGNVETTCAGDSCEVVHWAESLRNRYPAKKCSTFFIDDKGKSKGKLGKNSQLLMHDIARDVVEKYKKGETSTFLKSYPDLVQNCPGYTDMGPAEKVEMWAWVFEILAYNESSCDSKTADNEAANVPNGSACGLYQLDCKRELRKKHGKECDVDDQTIHTPEANTACAIDYMRGDLNKTGLLFGSRNSKGVSDTRFYWYSLIVAPKKEVCSSSARHNLLIRDLHDFPLCKYSGRELPDCEPND